MHLRSAAFLHSVLLVNQSDLPKIRPRLLYEFDLDLVKLEHNSALPVVAIVLNDAIVSTRGCAKS